MKRNVYYRHAVALVLFIFITGCSTMNNKFSCQATAGDSCLSIDKVNAMYSKGKDNSLYASTQNKAGQKRSATHQKPPVNPWPRQTARLWIAPWQDDNQLTHGEHYVYSQSHSAANKHAPRSQA